MQTTTLEAAERLSSALVGERAAEAAKLKALVDLAVQYRVADSSQEFATLLPELTEKLLPVGGDGCPLISEFCTMELAGIMGISVPAATKHLHRALNLRFRHPVLWTAVQDLDVVAWVALEVAKRCDDLPAADALVVTDKWMERQHELGPGDALDLVDTLIAKQRPDLVREKERKQLKARFVDVGRYRHGVMQLYGQLDVLDAKYFDAALLQIAELLAEFEPSDEEETVGELKARAVGYLANPARALALLQRAAQQPLFDGAPQAHGDGLPDDEEHDPASDHPAATPACDGHTCGSVEVDPEKLLPKVTVVVHLDPDSLITGVARIAQAGVMALETLQCLLQERRVVVQPVIDLPRMKPEERYRPSRALREAVRFTWGDEEAFPFSSRPAARMDIDHIRSYLGHDPARFTHLGNLAPLSRRAHRAKTAGYWHAEPVTPGTIRWRSPLGYRYEVSATGTRRLE